LSFDGSAEGLEEAPVASELRRAITRCARGSPDIQVLQTRLARLVAFWRRSSRSSQPVLQPRSSDAAVFRRGPRIFLDRTGSNAAEISWIVVGDLETVAAAFEVELFGHRSPSSHPRGGDGADSLLGEHLGRFLVPGGSAARSHTLRRLRPLRRHRARVRALGPRKEWMSAWSDDVSFMTLSVEAAQEAGHRMTADGFFARSEQRICRSVCGGGGDSLEQALGDILGSALGAEGKASAVKNLLDARSCKDGWQDFVRHGARYSQPPSERQQRMQRMRLVLSSKELYKPEYADGNAWSMGPFYYEEVGRLTMEAAQRVEERIAAAGGA